jgi:hypothetical protein
LLLASTVFVQAESHPHDGSQPSEPPQFSVGLRVRWSDGSEGQIVGRAEWRPQGAQGQWHYPVQFGGPDSLCWSLPEQGLQFIEEPAL